MTDEHPNISVLKQFDPTNLAGSADVIAEDMVFHFFNSELPDVQGDYVGLDGLQTFFSTLMKATNGTFKINPVSVIPVGDELVVVHTKNTMTFPDREVETDVVVVWRILDGRLTEAWDIPSLHTARVTAT